MGILVGKIADDYGITVERLTYAIDPDKWTAKSWVISQANTVVHANTPYWNGRNS